jgi:hypothetical protein
MNNKKNLEKKLATADRNSEKLAKYANAPYFKEKNRKAAEFLKKHPIPEKFLK